MGTSLASESIFLSEHAKITRELTLVLYLKSKCTYETEPDVQTVGKGELNDHFCGTKQHTAEKIGVKPGMSHIRTSRRHPFEQGQRCPACRARLTMYPL